MKEIHIDRSLLKARHNKGISQEELAAYMGVSKAAVSKWENAQSYPDITLLPKLAAYFNLSVDEMIGYEPQMVPEDIKKLYLRLSDNFSKKPFEEVYKECEAIIEKYYSCFPLLKHMALLLMNHFPLAKETEPVMDKIVELLLRVEKESSDVKEVKEAVDMQAAFYLMTGNPQKVLDIYGDNIRLLSQETDAIAQAYLMLGNREKAEEIVQVGLYQHAITFVGETSILVAIAQGENEKAEESIEKLLILMKLYHLEGLHVNVAANAYLSALGYYTQCGKKEKALDMLERYVKFCGSIKFPITLHGDSYFDKIGDWLENTLQLGGEAPRTDALIRKSLLQVVSENPALDTLKEEYRYKQLIKELEAYVEVYE